MTRAQGLAAGAAAAFVLWGAAAATFARRFRRPPLVLLVAAVFAVSLPFAFNLRYRVLPVDHVDPRHGGGPRARRGGHPRADPRSRAASQIPDRARLRTVSSSVVADTGFVR